MPLRLYNTLTRSIEPLVARDPARVTFYSCGPTVYDDAHIGNFRSFLAADVLRRWIESPWCEILGTSTLRGESSGAPQPHKGPRRVVHVMNITDVGHMTDDSDSDGGGEDKMAVAGRRLIEAKKAGKLPANVEVDPSDPYQIARFYEMRFKEDARRLGLKLVTDADKEPGLMPKATDHVPGMIAVIQRLMDRGHAYVAGTPGSRVVYFRVKSFEGYGRLSGNTLDRLREGEGGRISAANQSSKEHPGDFMLWKEDPRHIMKWESPWGAGYPGWHIECSAMAVTGTWGSDQQAGEPASQRGKTGPVDLVRFSVPDAQPILDLHSGGEDNIFPHHECEMAQSCCAFNAEPGQAPLAAMWFHPRFLFVEGQKMSKSKGNFFTARDLFAKGYEPAAVRLELIRTHYRSNADFREQGLKDSQRMIDRWRRIVDVGEKGPAGNTRSDVAERFAEAMQEDLNIAEAIAQVNKWAGETSSPTAADAALMRQLDAVLGLLELERPVAAQTSVGVFCEGLDPDPRVITKLEERAGARASKNFKRSDEIRDELLAMGYAIKDVAGGKVEVRRK